MANYVAIRLYNKDGKIAIPQDCWPVGSIYISINNVNPTKYFGGTWVAFGTGRTLVGVDSNQTEFKSVEKTGGAKTHTLTKGQIPSHNHEGKTGTALSSFLRVVGAAGTTIAVNHTVGYASGAAFVDTNGGNIPGANHYHEFTTSSVGNGEAHNNLQPYITVYFWKRTA